MVVDEDDMNEQIKGNMNYLKAEPERGIVVTDSDGEATITFTGIYPIASGFPIVMLHPHSEKSTAGGFGWYTNGVNYISVVFTAYVWSGTNFIAMGPLGDVSYTIYHRT